MQSKETPVRLYFEAEQSIAKRCADHIMYELEDDGIPVAVFETDADTGIWTVSIYCDKTDTETLSKRIAGLISERAASEDKPSEIVWQCEKLGDVDWVTETLKDLVPVYAGRFVVYGSHDAHVLKSNQLSINIDAGQAFGTGHHATTSGCLDLLTKAMKRRRYYNALDLGTGSAVLAIAAAKAQPLPVLATDIDPVAVEVAKRNVKINGCSKTIKCMTANGLQHRVFAEQGPFDLIMANILARPLEQMSFDICRHLKPGGTLILSGLLKHQIPRVANAFRQQGLSLREASESDNWVALLLE